MKRLAAITLLLFAATASASITNPTCNGVLYGTAFSPDDRPVPGVKLQLYPLGVDLAYVLPTTTTNDAGAYRFEHVCAGRFTVLVEDERAGYPYGIWTLLLGETQEVKLTPQHPQIELPVHVPPKAASLDVIARNRKTGAIVRNIKVTLKVPQSPKRTSISFNYCSSDWPCEKLLLPSNRDLLCRVTADGFREWQEGGKKGKSIRLAPGTHLTLDVALQPKRR